MTPDVESLSLEEAERALAELEGTHEQLPDPESLNLEQATALLNSLEPNKHEVSPGVRAMSEHGKKYLKEHNLMETGTEHLKNLSRTAKDVGVGVTTSVPNLLALLPYAGTHAVKALGGPDYTFDLPSDKLHKMIDTATGGYTKANTPGERIAQVATESVAGMNPLKVAGSLLSKLGPKAVNKVGQILHATNSPTVGNIATAAAVPAATQTITEEFPGNPLLSLAGGMSTGITTQLAADLLTKGRVPSLFAKMGKYNPEAMEAAQRAKIPVTPANVMDSENVNIFQNAARHIPFVGGPIQKAMQKTRDAIVSALGVEDPTMLTTTRGGELVHEAAKKTGAQHQKLTDIYLKKIRKSLEDAPNKRVDPKNANKFVQVAKRNLESESSNDDFWMSPLGQFGKKLQNILAKRTDFSGAPVTRTGSFKDMLALRQSIDDSVTTWGIHGNKSKGELKRLSNQINRDIGNMFKEIGGDAYKTWQEYNHYYSNYMKKTLPTINKINGLMHNDKGIEAFMSVLPSKKGARSLETVLNGLTEKSSKKELFNIVTNYAGNTPYGFSTFKYMRFFNNLDKPVQERLLRSVGYDKKGMQNYDDVMDTIGRVWKSSEQENKSKSYVHYTQMGAYAWILNDITSGRYGKAALTASAIAAGTAASHVLFNNQRLIKWMANGAKITSSTQFPRWAKAINSIPGVPESFKKGFKEIYTDILHDSQKVGLPTKLAASPISAMYSLGSK